MSFPAEEKKDPWLSSLLDAYAMIDASVFIALEIAEKKSACKKGCSLCCFQTIPLTYLELFGIQWLKEKEKRERLQHKKNMSLYTEGILAVQGKDRYSQASAGLTVKKEDSEQKYQQPCPMLKDNTCSIYPLRPIACRRFMVLGETCKKDEDCFITRPSDVLHPSQKILENALLLTQPFYVKTGQWTKEKSDISPFFGELLTEIGQFDWFSYE